jgi:hypothetical protein
MKHLDRPLAPGDPIAAIPAQWINDVDAVLKRLAVYGGKVNRNGNNWTISVDEVFDTDGRPATAAGRWKTGETDTAVTKTCYADLIWNAAGTEQAIRLDDRSLRAHDTSGAVKMFTWEDTTHAGDTTAGNVLHSAFNRAVWFEKMTHAEQSGTVNSIVRTWKADQLQSWPGEYNSLRAEITDSQASALIRCGTLTNLGSSKYARTALQAQAGVGGDDLGARICRTSDTSGALGTNYAGQFFLGAVPAFGGDPVVYIGDLAGTGMIDVRGANSYSWAVYTHDEGIYSAKHIRSDSQYEVSGTKVVGARVIDARADDAVSSGAYDTTTAGVIDSLRDAMITHGLIAPA